MASQSYIDLINFIKSRNYEQYIDTFLFLGVKTINDLNNITDSQLRDLNYSDPDRYKIFKVIVDLLDQRLPGDLSGTILYAFDLDGTLTEEPGDHESSLWSKGEEYYNSLSIEKRDIMFKLLITLPDDLILISRNSEHNIRTLFGQLNSELANHINEAYSAFRSSGLFPTERSKLNALINLQQADKPIIYIDDTLKDINLCKKIETAKKCIHIDAWLGNTDVLNHVRDEAEVFNATLVYQYVEASSPRIIINPTIE
ncbi:MAG: hypothetical protein MUO21_08565 [Nitrososphaeraceae archaeon]|nr:hypothetical protein [Nitrososphaeraceae archaeon]